MHLIKESYDFSMISYSISDSISLFVPSAIIRCRLSFRSLMIYQKTGEIVCLANQPVSEYPSCDDYAFQLWAVM